MHNSGPPNGGWSPNSGWSPPTQVQKPKRPVILQVIGWILIGFGVLGGLVSLGTGQGLAGKLGGFFIGLAFVAVGCLLVWRINWKIGVPAAIAALFLGGIISPQPPVNATGDQSTGPTSSTSQTTTTTTTPSSKTTSSAKATTTTPATTTPERTTTVTQQTSEPVDAPDPTTPRRRHPTTTQAPAVTTEDGGGGGGQAFGSCAEAHRAGAAPLYRGQPGYSPSLDGDHDGVACE